MRSLFACLAVSVLLLAGCSKSAEPEPDAMEADTSSPSAPSTDADPVEEAMSAAPGAIAKSAAVMGPDDKGEMTMLRKGTNGWTCMPNDPSTPTVDPMCVDEGGLAFIMAWLEKKDPPKGTMGFGYMLRGGPTADNDDPFATKPPKGKDWVNTGPHVMIFNVGDSFPGYPTTAENTKVPYVMWPDTPYAHLMIPVE